MNERVFLIKNEKKIAEINYYWRDMEKYLQIQMYIKFVNKVTLSSFKITWTFWFVSYGHLLLIGLRRGGVCIRWILLINVSIYT